MTSIALRGGVGNSNREVSRIPRADKTSLIAPWGLLPVTTIAAPEAVESSSDAASITADARLSCRERAIFSTLMGRRWLR